MRCTLPNLRQTLDRWARPSTLLILAIALGYFGPPLWDRYLREVPWISASLAIEITTEPQPQILIRDTVAARHHVAGERLVWMENRAGHRICGSHREDSWVGEDTRTWTVRAFFEAACGEPTVPWRACTRFVVQSDYGNLRGFGNYCSDYHHPAASG